MVAAEHVLDEAAAQVEKDLAAADVLLAEVAARDERRRRAAAEPSADLDEDLDQEASPLRDD
jgi:hypothetical protein